MPVVAISKIANLPCNSTKRLADGRFSGQRLRFAAPIFEITGHGRDPLVAIKQSTECTEPVSRTEWRWFGGRLARPLRRDRLLHVHFRHPRQSQRGLLANWR
jgi:hypothetical protein